MSQEIKLVTPISHLFNNIEDGISISKYSDQLEARERTADLRFSNTTHYHIDFDLNLGLTEDQKKFLASKVKCRPEIHTLTFQITRDTENFIMSEGKFYPKGYFVDKKEQIERTKNSINIIKDIVGSDKSIGIENNNFYNTGAYDIATSSKFINQLVKETDVHLLLDIAHAKVTCKNKKINFKNYINEMVEDIPCKQMHICETSERISRGINETYDAHFLPTQESIKEAIEICNNFDITSLTVEYYRDSKKLINCLKTIKKIINNL